MPKNVEIRPEMDKEVGGTAMAAEMGMGSGLEPCSLAEVMKGPDWHHWREAMEEELVALEAHSTWKLVDLPTGANLVHCCWTYVVKKDAVGNIVCDKAHLIAQGFSQVLGIDFFDTYAPITKMASSQLALAYGACWDYKIHQVDIKNAYLNAKFEEGEVIHMKQPPGVTLTENKKKVLQLLWLLYGLRQSTWHWYHRLFGVLCLVWNGARLTRLSSISGRRMPSSQYWHMWTT